MICFMALWGFWNDRARDLDRLLSVMPDFDAARFDAGQLQQAIARLVKILEQPENRRPAMMDGWYERQSLGSSAGVCNGAGEPGTAAPKRVLGCGESSSASALARTAALSDPERRTLAEIGKRLGRKGLEKVACAAKPDTILAWYRRLIARKFDGSQSRRYHGRPRI